MPFPRNRLQTQARILEAARCLLSESGFMGWGLNALAARSLSDKVLIYRYFGDLDGVESALAREEAPWLPGVQGTVLESAQRLGAQLRDHAYVCTLLRWTHVHAGSPLMERALRERQSWERACAQDLTGALRAERAHWIFDTVLADPSRPTLWRASVEGLIHLGTPTPVEPGSYWSQAQLPTELL